MDKRHPNVSNADEIPWADGPRHGTRFASRYKPLAATSGGRRIGASLYELDPGKRAYPMHAHAANEEAAYILDGAGTVRIGDREVPVRAGDYLAFPAGREHAHQIINTSEAPLRFLTLSTMDLPEIALYTDAGKLGARWAEGPAGRLLFKESTGGSTLADYFEGEAGD
jgi:uncharacterized cupin superfamily protein